MCYLCCLIRTDHIRSSRSSTSRLQNHFAYAAVARLTRHAGLAAPRELPDMARRAQPAAHPVDRITLHLPEGVAGLLQGVRSAGTVRSDR